MHFVETWRHVAAGLVIGLAAPAVAADHAEAPGTTGDPAADLTDVYAWHTGVGTLVVVVDFAPHLLPGDPALYDPDLLYGVHLDLDADGLAETDIWTRFGQSSQGVWGVQVTGMPGTGAPVVGPVETVIAAPGGQVFAGLREDPFFFDFEGFGTTLATATLAFDPTRDFFANENITTIVLEFDAATALDGGTAVKIWATTSRI